MIHSLLRDLRDVPFVDFWHQIRSPAAKQAKPSSKLSRNSFRRHLSIPGMIRGMRECFDRIPDPMRDLTLSGVLMPGLVAFPPRMPSRPLFDKRTRRGEDPVQARNLGSLFGVEMPSSDSCC